jgi:hypothetical protein
MANSKPRGGRKVKSARQAIAIGLGEAGASTFQSATENRRNLRRTKRRERNGATAKARDEGSHRSEQTFADLYEEARRQNLPGRSKMDKRELRQALRSARDRGGSAAWAVVPEPNASARVSPPDHIEKTAR